MKRSQTELSDISDESSCDDDMIAHAPRRQYRGRAYSATPSAFEKRKLEGHRNDKGNTALLYAAAASHLGPAAHLELVKSALCDGSDGGLTKNNHSGLSPFMAACGSGNLSVVRFLDKKVRKISIRNHSCC